MSGQLERLQVTEGQCKQMFSSLEDRLCYGLGVSLPEFSSTEEGVRYKDLTARGKIAELIPYLRFVDTQQIEGLKQARGMEEIAKKLYESMGFEYKARAGKHTIIMEKKLN